MRHLPKGLCAHRVLRMPRAARLRSRSNFRVLRVGFWVEGLGPGHPRKSCTACPPRPRHSLILLSTTKRTKTRVYCFGCRKNPSILNPKAPSPSPTTCSAPAGSHARRARAGNARSAVRSSLAYSSIWVLLWVWCCGVV